MKNPNCQDTRPTVSVIILSYGNYSYLDRTIRSILEQTCQIQKIVLSDDGSGIPFPDNVKEILSGWSGDVECLENKINRGTCVHANWLARKCDSKFIKFLASGDAFSDPNALSALMQCAEQGNTVITTSNALICSADLSGWYYVFPGSKRAVFFSASPSEQYRALALSNAVSATGTLFHRDFFCKSGGFDESYRLLEDWPAWLKWTRAGKPIGWLDRVTCLYGLGGVSSAQSNAFRAEELRSDMRLCYEKEILPYLDVFPASERKVILHYSNKLQGNGEHESFVITLKDTIKRRIKWLVLAFMKKKLPPSSAY